VRRLLAAGLASALLFGTAGSTSANSETRFSWKIVSFAGAIQPADREMIESRTDGSLFYLHPDSYIAYLGPAAASGLLRSARVEQVRSLSVRERVTDVPGPLAAVVVHRDGLASWMPLVATAGWASSAERDLITLMVPSSVVPRFARHPAVLSVGPGALTKVPYDEQSSQIVAGNTESGKPVVGYDGFLAELGLDGSGVRLAIADSGIDDQHPDLQGRVVARTDFTQLPDHRDSDGHGTHVAGIAAGGGVLQGANDPNGFHYGLGVAPRVDLVDVGVLGIIEEIVGIDEFPPFEEATSYAIGQGAFGWNASWGSGDGDRVGYVENARTMDLLARDGDWDEPGAQPFILVFAAGNSGFAGPGAPTEAKNLISVAASRSARAGNIETPASFSSRGPAKDGRIGPTIAAPGDVIVAPRSTASVLCNTPPREASPLVVLYATCSGTSMAAPHVAGAVSLLVQWWGQRHPGAVPSPAMVKAMLVNSAHDMGGKDIPNIHEGWGRVNLRELFDPSLERALMDQVSIFDAVGEEHTWTIEPVDPSRPMKISLVWTDAPGAPNANPAIVNDLDLSLVSGSTTYRGNVFSAGMSVPGGSYDRLEVVENIFLEDPSGQYMLRVRAANLPGDGVPGGDGTDQDYALVMSNARIV
jgi:subtilisin family serine protease